MNEFIQAIYDDPADDTRRLIFADWLEEQGNIWSTVIRSQIQGSKENFRSLISRHCEEWFPNFPFDLLPVDWERGMPSQVTCTPFQLYSHFRNHNIKTIESVVVRPDHLGVSIVHDNTMVTPAGFHIPTWKMWNDYGIVQNNNGFAYAACLPDQIKSLTIRGIPLTAYGLSLTVPYLTKLHHLTLDCVLRPGIGQFNVNDFCYNFLQKQWPHLISLSINELNWGYEGYRSGSRWILDRVQKSKFPKLKSLAINNLVFSRQQQKELGITLTSL